jgi:cytochrome c biogenesis protein
LPKVFNFGIKNKAFLFTPTPYITLRSSPGLKLFRSVRFNVWLFVVIALASSLGTFIPQGETMEEYVRRFGTELAPVMSHLGLFDVYHSWWFIFLLGLMGFDVIACKLRSLPKISPLGRHNRHMDGERLLSSQPLKYHMVALGGAEDIRQKLRDHLGLKRYSLEHQERTHGTILQATRYKWQGWGDFIVHVSIVLILAGALVGAVWGFKEFMMVIPGQSRGMEHKPWTLTLDDFKVYYYSETGSPSRYQSRVRLSSGERLITQSTIIVNKPLDVGGVRFYQASWGMTGMLKSATLQVGRSRILIHRGERVPIRGTPLSVEAMMLYPDFDVDEAGRPTTKSLEPNNPAVLVRFFQGENPMVTMWLFQKRPEVCLRVGPKGELTPAAHPPFRLADFKPVLFSGFQVSYDPGARLFWIGCAILLAGLVMRFYFHHRRLLLIVKEEGPGESRVSVGGWSSHGPEDFKEEFHRLMNSCKRALSAKETVYGSPTL